MLETHSQKSKLVSITEFIFFGNYFYGACAVALSVEASLQQHYLLNYWYFYVCLFSVTVSYYTIAYISDLQEFTKNPRTNWYIKNKYFVKISQWILKSLPFIFLLPLIILHPNWFSYIHVLDWLLILIFPAVAILYYGLNLKTNHTFNLRTVGWLKPFVIGFSWAGLVTLYPVMFYNISHEKEIALNLLSFLLFLKNFMFISVLAIMFDIKDYAMDYNTQLKTFVVHHGLRKTIFFIIIPLCILGLGSFISYGILHHFSIYKITLNVLSFVLLLGVAMSLQNRHSIMYYLIIIDGLMLVKAICGIVAMIYF